MFWKRPSSGGFRRGKSNRLYCRSSRASGKIPGPSAESSSMKASGTIWARWKNTLHYAIRPYEPGYSTICKSSSGRGGVSVRSDPQGRLRPHLLPRARARRLHLHLYGIRNRRGGKRLLGGDQPIHDRDRHAGSPHHRLRLPKAVHAARGSGRCGSVFPARRSLAKTEAPLSDGSFRNPQASPDSAIRCAGFFKAVPGV